jgi:hypothetical protein
MQGCFWALGMVRSLRIGLSIRTGYLIHRAAYLLIWAALAADARKPVRRAGIDSVARFWGSRS